MNTPDARGTFLSPPMSYRSAPFWFWNDKLDPDRLVWQFDQMVDAGTGGACLHARSGLDPEEYLDERWFAGVDAVLDRALERKAIIWLYDELGWPSGTAGGRVLREYPNYRAQALQMHDVVVKSGDDLPDDPVAAFRVTTSDPMPGFWTRNDGGVTLIPEQIEYERIVGDLSAERLAGERVLVFTHTTSGSLDYLKPEAAQAFLRSTHEEYYRRYGEHFGSTITHIFMDEAGMFARKPGSIPWTDGFAEQFAERRGGDVIARLPDLFFDTAGCEATRFDYWTTATELFREGFGVELHKWCEAHNIYYTGHYVFETSMKEAIKELGSTMALYEHMGFPGIDVLGNDMYSVRFEQEAYGYYALMVKQAASVVNQLGKPGLMSESHGVGGNAMLPEDFQTVHNWQMALGVTHVNQHAPFYSIRGKRKLDCPPIIGWQNPYWKFVNNHLNTVARTGWLLNQGRRKCETLVLHTSASMQASYRQLRHREEYKAENYVLDADMPFELIDKHTTLLTSALLDAQIDFEFGDEEIMARHGSAENGGLSIGRMTYSVVVLPPSINIRSTTLDLLRQYVESGGALLCTGSAPTLLDGRPSEELVRFLDKHAERIVDGVDRFDYSRLVARLTEMGRRSVELSADGRDVPSMKVHRRIWDDREIIYVANISREDVTARLQFTVDVDGTVEEWDTSTGTVKPVAPCTAGRPFERETTWPARGARAFVASPGQEPIPRAKPLTEIARETPAWSGRRNDPNLFRLDACTLVTSEGETELMSISDAQAWLAKHDEQPTAARFPFTISAESPPVEPLSVAAELQSGQTVSLNGSSVSVRPTGWLFDPANLTLELPAPSAGENILEITLRGASKISPDELEAPILIGEFRTVTSDNATFVLEAADRHVEPGPWPAQGMHFYTGTVTYSAEFDMQEGAEEVHVVLSDLHGASEVRVNGEVVGRILWPPYEADGSSALKPGANTVEIEVANTLRNIYGSHYCEDETTSAGIAISTYSAPLGTPKQFRDYGLLAEAEIHIRG